MMKRFLCLCLTLILLCVPCVSCKKEENTAEPPSMQELKRAILAWNDVTAYDLTHTTCLTRVEDGDTDNAAGSASQFAVRRIGAEKGNMYFGTYTWINSMFGFEMTEEYYYYDGWSYRIWRDSGGVEELNEYEREAMDEQTFSGVLFAGLEPFLVTEAELDAGTAEQSGDVTTLSVTVTDPATVEALTGDDLANLALMTDTDPADYAHTDPVVSYAVRDGALVGVIASYEFSIGTKVYSYEYSHTINAVDDAVQGFTLPEDADSYPIAGEES